jgi:hypothetical protein
MVVRLDTTLAATESAVWSPTDQIVLQVEAAYGAALIDVMVRVDAAASFRVIHTIRAELEPISRLPYYPFMKVAVRGNKAGSQVRVWDNG